MDKKEVEHAVSAIRKRLDKHFLASAEMAVSDCPSYFFLITAWSIAG